MKIGISRPDPPAFPAADIDAAVLARHVEAAGFESLFYGEHPVTPAEEAGYGPHSAVPYFQDTLVALTRASAATSRLIVGGGVFLVARHEPVLFAKQLASLDFYTGGRLVAGCGFGWSRGQCQAMGVDFDRRFARGIEAIRVMKALWRGEVTQFQGEFFAFPPIRIHPAPAQKGGPPVLLPGGPLGFDEPWDSPRLETRFRRIVDHADGWIPAMIGREGIENGPYRIEEARRLMARLCRESGRDPAGIQTTILLRGTSADPENPDWPSRDTLRAYAGLGVERVLVKVPPLAGAEQLPEVLARMADRVL